MANALGYYNPALYASEALSHLTKRLGMANRCHTNLERERGSFNKGDTINVKRPSTFVTAAAPSSAVDLQTESIQMTMTNWREVKFALTDKEVAYTTEQIIRDHIRPAAYAIADYIDQQISALTPLFANYAGASATAGDSATFAMSQVVLARKKAFDAKIPLSDVSNMFGQVNGTTEADFLSNSQFALQFGGGTQGEQNLIDGAIGRRLGINWYANQNTYSTMVTSSTLASLTGITSAAADIGATSLVLSKTTTNGEILYAGSIISVASASDGVHQYVVTANATIATNAMTVSISPPVQGAAGNATTGGILAGAAVTVIYAGDTASTTENLIWHRDAMALVMVKLPDTAADLGAQVFTVQDPITGLAIRARIFYVGDTSKIYCALDVLFGLKVLNPYLGVRWVRK